MRGIVEETEYNDTYGRWRMYHALKLKYPNKDIFGERIVYRIMKDIGLSHWPNGITKADRKNKDLAKENARLKEENEVLAQANAFFAASRQKSTRTWEWGSSGKKTDSGALTLFLSYCFIIYNCISGIKDSY